MRTRVGNGDNALDNGVWVVLLAGLRAVSSAETGDKHVLKMIITIMSQLYKPQQKLKHPKTGHLQPQTVVLSGKELSRSTSAQVSGASALLVAALNRCITPGVTDDWWSRTSPSKRCAVFHAFRLALLGVPEPRLYVDAIRTGTPLTALFCSGEAICIYACPPLEACYQMFALLACLSMSECSLRVSVEIVSLAASCPLLLRVMVHGALYCVANKIVEELKYCA